MLLCGEEVVYNEIDEPFLRSKNSCLTGCNLKSIRVLCDFVVHFVLLKKYKLSYQLLIIGQHRCVTHLYSITKCSPSNCTFLCIHQHLQIQFVHTHDRLHHTWCFCGISHQTAQRFGNDLPRHTKLIFQPTTS